MTAVTVAIVVTDTTVAVAAEDMVATTVATVVTGNLPAHQPARLARAPLQLEMPQTMPPSMPPNTMVLILTPPTVDTRTTSPIISTTSSMPPPSSSSNSPKALLLPLPRARRPLHLPRALGLPLLLPVLGPPVPVLAATARYVIQCAPKSKLLANHYSRFHRPPGL